MKPRTTNILFFIFGVGIFSYLVYRFGIQTITRNIEQAGWSLLYVIGIWFVIYLCNTAAWKLVLGPEGKKITFLQLFMVTVSGFVINYITPVIALGGEPYKVNALSGAMGTRQSFSVVVMYRMIHLLGHMFLLLTGIVAALVVLALPPVVDAVIILAGVLVLAVIGMTLGGYRKGIFQRLVAFVARIPFLRKISDSLQRYEQNLKEMDEVITNVYHQDRKKLYGSVILEYFSRILMGIEVYLILKGINVETTVVSALFLYVSYSIIINLLFFIPLNLGAREGGLALGLESLALPPLLGVYLGIVMRVREFFWILLGLLFILLTNMKQKSLSKVL